MNPDRWKKLDELLDVALELEPDKRAAFLDEACAGDEALRKEIEGLIAADREDDILMKSSALQVATEFIDPALTSRLSPDEIIGPYRIISLLGTGGMGEVYRACDQRLERDVAIKILPEYVSKNPDALVRFDREVKTLAALSHPNIIAIYDVGDQNGIVFAVMELLKGETLRSYLARTRLTWEKAVQVGSSILDGLTAAHSQGVIHRDLKPENIFLTSDGGVKILDFGLMRRNKPIAGEGSPNSDSLLTNAGIAMGTVPYMSPEQLRGLPVDARSDLFSFGTMLYEMISGKRPFSGINSADLTASILKEEPAPLTVNCPVTLNHAVLRCLKKDPDQRFQTAASLASDLKTVTDSSLITAGLPTGKRQWNLLLLIPALLVVVVLFFYFPSRTKTVHSIAVLPFLNANHDPNDEYLIDGVTDSIIDKLSQFPDLRVMARGTVFTYKGKEIDPRKIGRELKVESVVTGRILQNGDSIVISADLVKVSDGTLMWGKQYNRRISDLLLVQSEISRDLSDKLNVHLTGEQQKAVSKNYTENLEAYQFFLRGRYHWMKDTQEDYTIAQKYFEKAIEKDPSFARAYIALAGYYVTLGQYGIAPPNEQWAKSLAALKRAKELDPWLVEAHMGDAEYQFYHEWNWTRTEQALKRGIELSPGDPDLRHFYGQFLRAMGRWDEAIAEEKQSQLIDPLTIVANKSVGIAYSWAKRYDEALDAFKKTEELDPNYAGIHDALADVYVRKGMVKEAIFEMGRFLRLSGDEESANKLILDFQKSGYDTAMQSLYEKELNRLIEDSKERYVSPMSFAIIYSLLNRKNEAFEWLEKAYQERSSWLVFLKTDPQFDNLRSDPRWAAMVKKIGLPM